jgi:hypothetical protein
MWRLMAADNAAKRKHQYELVHFTLENVWRLVRVYD